MPDCLCCVCDFASVCTYISYQNSCYHTKEKPICYRGRTSIFEWNVHFRIFLQLRIIFMIFAALNYNIGVLCRFFELLKLIKFTLLKSDYSKISYLFEDAGFRTCKHPYPEYGRFLIIGRPIYLIIPLSKIFIVGVTCTFAFEKSLGQSSCTCFHS